MLPTKGFAAQQAGAALEPLPLNGERWGRMISLFRFDIAVFAIRISIKLEMNGADLFSHGAGP